MSPHGNRNRYVTSGCRCDECRAAQREYVAARRAVALSEGNLTHGRRATYDAGCRCEQCRSTRLVAYYTREAVDRRHRKLGVVA